ncbi:MAG: cation-translocating P-type ATPase, partial [Vicinamibacteria bacterium]|nr:cation-translocating P-type ATPase [Vicinamibacteria bacterium]
MTLPATASAPPALPGLDAAEAARRLVEHGPNQLAQQAGSSAWTLLAAQFKGAMIWLLLLACAASAVLGAVADALAIGTILVLNAIVGFVQEHRAERAVLALRALSAARARVVRDGQVVQIAAAEVVPGDLLQLEAGDVVAADGRLREAHALQVVEGLLTGESAPVEKGTSPTSPETPLADRLDWVFFGTAVATGRGVAEVAATGMGTEMGKIASLLASTVETQTPLQRQLDGLGRTLLILCLVIVALVSGLGLLHGMAPLEVLLYAVALAVAAVPEGLPAIVTVALALGVQRMAARNAIVRRLASVETLGCATVICTDKTGTLTTGRMEVREVWGPDRRQVLHAAAACNDAELAEAGDVGDPTEVALLKAAAAEGIQRTDIERDTPRQAETPFDSERKRMSVRRAEVLYVKGAPEVVIPLCTAGTAGAKEAEAQMAQRGWRVLAVAVGQTAEERDLTLLGLVAIADPPRPEAIEAIARARQAGIRTVMITGDHPATALAIARELQIVGADEDPAGLVHARVTAEEKIEIVRKLKREGEIVAMTGDGVNDAPALREAHIGIAMGRGGTEVTREASDMVLTDDNFATIVAAVEEGRGIHDNIRKTLVYLLTGNTAELTVMLAASALALPLPLLPLQLLWINLVTDGLPALALVMDRPLPGVLDRAPRPPGQAILGRPEWTRIGLIAMVEAGVVLSVFLTRLEAGTVAEARSFAFSTLVFCELFRAFAARSRALTFWQVGTFT